MLDLGPLVVTAAERRARDEGAPALRADRGRY